MAASAMLKCTLAGLLRRLACNDLGGREGHSSEPSAARQKACLVLSGGMVRARGRRSSGLGLAFLPIRLSTGRFRITAGEERRARVRCHYPILSPSAILWLPYWHSLS